MRDEYLCSGHPTLQDAANVPEEFDDPFDHKALAFQYNEETYILWLDLHDDFGETNQVMEERYSEHLFFFFRWAYNLPLIIVFCKEKGTKECKRSWMNRRRN